MEYNTYNKTLYSAYSHRVSRAIKRRRKVNNRQIIYVLRYCLNESSESVGSLRYAGRLFQTAGPDTLNARPPNVDCSTGGTMSWLLLADHRVCRDGLPMTRTQISVKYSGAMPCRQQCTMTAAIRNSMRSIMSSQCSLCLMVWCKPRLYLPRTCHTCHTVTNFRS